MRSRIPLWLLALLSLVFYTLLPLFFPLIPTYDRIPLSDLRSFRPSLGAGLAYALLLLLLYACYLLAYRHVREKSVSMTAILLTAVLFGLPLLFTYPINANDVYRYFIRARLTTVYDANPMAVAPNAFPDDPFLPLAGEWADATSPYGPLWELTAAGITVLSGQRLLLALIYFKGLGMLMHLASAILIWLTLAKHSRAERVARTLLWAWNPALLLMFIVDAHNDVLMLFWLLLGFYLMERRGWHSAGFLTMVLAPLTKMIGLLPLPFFFLSAWRRLPTVVARLRFLVVSALGSLALAGAFFLPFGSPLDLAYRLLRESSGAAGFSPATLLLLLARRMGFPIAIETVAAASLLLFTLLSLILLWLTWRGRSPLRGVADVFMSYLVTALTFRIWYTTWPFPWLLIERRSGGRLAAGLGFLLAAQLSVVIYGHVRAYLLAGDHLLAHLIGISLVFLLPFLFPFFFHSNLRSGTRQT